MFNIVGVAKRWSVPRMQGNGSTTELGGIMEVTMLGFDLAWVQYLSILCWF